MPAKEEYLTYKGRPLVRSGNIIYYGDMADDYVVMFQIQSSKPFDDISLSEKVSIQLLATDPNISPKEKVVKRSEKIGLYNAIDIGSIWLERALKNSVTTR